MAIRVTLLEDLVIRDDIAIGFMTKIFFVVLI